jgi:hypothetical protein
MCNPRLHFAPSAASEHPELLLNPKQIASPAGLDAVPPSLKMWFGTLTLPFPPFLPPFDLIHGF